MLLPVISPDDATELPLDLCVFIVSLVQLVYSPKTDVFPVELCSVDVNNAFHIYKSVKIKDNIEKIFMLKLNKNK